GRVTGAPRAARWILAVERLLVADVLALVVPEDGPHPELLGEPGRRLLEPALFEPRRRLRDPGSVTDDVLRLVNDRPTHRAVPILRTGALAAGRDADVHRGRHHTRRTGRAITHIRAGNEAQQI